MARRPSALWIETQNSTNLWYNHNKTKTPHYHVRCECFIIWDAQQYQQECKYEPLIFNHKNISLPSITDIVSLYCFLVDLYTKIDFDIWETYIMWTWLLGNMSHWRGRTHWRRLKYLWNRGRCCIQYHSHTLGGTSVSLLCKFYTFELCITKGHWPRCCTYSKS